MRSYQGRRDDSTCLGFHNLLGDPRLPSDQKNNGETVLSNPINELDNDWTGYNLYIDWDVGFAEFQIDHVLSTITITTSSLIMTPHPWFSSPV